jgi:hypothetical protein
MKRVWFFLTLLLLVFIVSCMPSVTVNNDYDSAYNFTKLKTYDWIPMKNAGNVSELKIKRFQNAINRELQAKGMTLSSENPDFLIALYGMAQTKVDVTDWGYNHGPNWWGMGERNVDVNTYKEGTIFLDFVDAANKQLFWRGSATSVVEPDLTAQQQEQKFTRAASKLLAPFPAVTK